MVQFDDLPDVCILEILRACEARWLFNLLATCRRLHLLGRDRKLWLEKVENDFGLVLPKASSKSASVLRKIYSVVHDTSVEDQYLSFQGLLTDGGMQSDMNFYFVDNMFSPYTQAVYCSGILVSDVRCVGLHSSHQRPPPLVPRNLTKFREAKREVTMNSSLLSVADRREEEFVAVRGLRIGRMGNLSCPIECGVVLLENACDPLDEEACRAELGREMYKKCWTRVPDALSGVLCLEALLDLCQSGELKPPLVVTWGDNCEWVEFDRGTEASWKVHPVVWFRFFKKEEFEARYEKQEQDRRQRLTAGFSSLGVECRNTAAPPPVPVNDEFVADALPSYVGSDEETFENQYAVVLPFAPYESYMSTPLMYGREYVEVSLRNPVIGNVMYVLLNSCENLMEETFDYGGPNIDMTLLNPVGRIITFTEGGAEVRSQSAREG